MLAEPVSLGKRLIDREGALDWQFADHTGPRPALAWLSDWPTAYTASR